MFAGQLGGFRQAGIHHHQFAAPFAQRLDTLAHIGHGPDAAVGRNGVGAKHEKVLAAVNVRNGKQRLVAEQPQAGEMVRQLVYRGGGKTVAGVEVAKQVFLMRHHPVVVYGGVTQIHAQGIHPIALYDVHQALGSSVQRLLPADVLPGVRLTRCAAHTCERPAQPIRVVVNILQSHGLGADVPPTQGVVRVALDRQYPLTIGFDTQAANGLAEVAGAMVHSGGHGRRLFVMAVAEV